RRELGGYARGHERRAAVADGGAALGGEWVSECGEREGGEEARGGHASETAERTVNGKGDVWIRCCASGAPCKDRWAPCRDHGRKWCGDEADRADRSLLRSGATDCAEWGGIASASAGLRDRFPDRG